MEQQTYVFESATQALTWATENMRRRMFPKISSVYKEIASPTAESSDSWRQQRSYLPSDAESVSLLTSKIFSCLKELDEMQQHLIILKYWGDFYEQGHFQRKVRQLELLRKQGHRVRLNYRYTMRQIASEVDMNYRTVHRNIEKAESAFEAILQNHGLLDVESDYIYQTKFKGVDAAVSC